MRRLSTIILIAITFAMFVNWNSAHAESTSEERVLYVLDFSDGKYTGALLNPDGDSYDAIKFTAAYTTTFEDMLSANNDKYLIALSTDQRVNTFEAYSAEYDQVITFSYEFYTDDSHIIGYVNTTNNVTTGTLDGDQVQFEGFVVNGACIKLRSANVLAQVHAEGYLLQNGMLIRYVATDKEERIYTINMPLVLR